MISASATENRVEAAGFHAAPPCAYPPNVTYSRSWLAAVMATLVAVGAAGCSDSGDQAATTRAATTTSEAPPTEVQSTKPPPPAKPPPQLDQKHIYAELARLRDRGAGGAALYRTVAEQAGTSVASVKLIERQGSLRRWALPRSPKPPPAAVRAGRPWGATRLRSTTSCSQNAPRTAIAHLRWRPAKPAGRTQWIVVTNLLRGFEFGKYEAAGPLKPRVASFAWRRVHGQSIHQWRVLTWNGSRWLGSPTAKFTGPTCVAEFEP